MIIGSPRATNHTVGIASYRRAWKPDATQTIRPHGSEDATDVAGGLGSVAVGEPVN